MIHIDLSDKVAVITGGSSALGRVMVRTLARAGADIAICYHQNEVMAERLLGEVEALGVRGMTVQADVTDADSIFSMLGCSYVQVGSGEHHRQQCRHSVQMGFGTGSTRRRLREPIPVVRATQCVHDQGFRSCDDRIRVGARDWHQHRMCNAELCESECLHGGKARNGRCLACVSQGGWNTRSYCKSGGSGLDD